ncbi:c-type cytochrome [Thalassomonas actiniarum]|uniref:C-type cytochrome n=1 Tax=Thalassomonas actiniarum TaxID=485447 RepID=A0AAE9YSU9_9GAMM|nr:c-type cytochrome [Thalassomonas actiniarum]WDE00108.1 c-type cytochrome [Thalassomonas actiniarum]
MKATILKKSGLVLLSAATLFAHNAYSATDIEAGKQLFEKSCADCHSITSNDNITLAQRLKEKAPTLYYAGNKFNREWLQSWLAAPTRLRPGGHFFMDNVKVTEDGDIIDESKLGKHMAVSAKQAQQLTGYLMAQTPKSALIQQESITLGKTNRTLGEKDFHKFKGCGSCHQDEDGYGGVSGPELYTSVKRLQPEFIASYTKMPEKWDPKTLMPNRHLNDNSVKKLLNYLNVISQ